MLIKGKLKWVIFNYFVEYDISTDSFNFVPVFKGHGYFLCHLHSRDYVVCPHHQRHIFRFHSITFEGMH